LLRPPSQHKCMRKKVSSLTLHGVKMPGLLGKPTWYAADVENQDH
jgi:hypothetical protein